MAQALPYNYGSSAPFNPGAPIPSDNRRVQNRQTGRAHSRAGGTRRQIRERTQGRQTEQGTRTVVPTQTTRANRPGRRKLQAAVMGETALRVTDIATIVSLGMWSGAYYFTFQLTLFFTGLIFIAISFIFSPLPSIPVAIMGVGFLANGVNAILCWGLMGIAWAVMAFKGIRSLSGENQNAKVALFIVAMVGYASTPLQFLPWIFLWLLAVARNPQ